MSDGRTGSHSSLLCFSHAGVKFNDNDRKNALIAIHVIPQARTKLTVARAEAAAAARYQPPPPAPAPHVTDMHARVESGGQTREDLQRHVEELRRQLLVARQSQQSVLPACQSQQSVQSHIGRGDGEGSQRGERIMLPRSIAQDMKHLVGDGLRLYPNCCLSTAANY